MMKYCTMKSKKLIHRIRELERHCNVVSCNIARLVCVKTKSYNDEVVYPDEPEVNKYQQDSMILLLATDHPLLQGF
jgi:hypothetical protein